MLRRWRYAHRTAYGIAGAAQPVLGGVLFAPAVIVGGL